MKVYELIPDCLYQRGEFRSMDINTKLNFLKEYGIDVIINVAPKCDAEMIEYALKDYIHYPFPDSGNFDRHEVAKVAEVGAIHILEGCNVLVHCHAGRNRSSLISGLIIHHLYPEMNGKNIVRYIRRKRPNALANEHFVKYLEEL